MVQRNKCGASGRKQTSNPPSFRRIWWRIHAVSPGKNVVSCLIERCVNSVCKGFARIQSLSETRHLKSSFTGRRVAFHARSDLHYLFDDFVWDIVSSTGVISNSKHLERKPSGAVARHPHVNLQLSPQLAPLDGCR